jgi:uncharacterized RDD family membrane protein YckC
MEKIHLASRMKRLGARIVDGGLRLLIYMALTTVAEIAFDKGYFSPLFVHREIFFALSVVIFFFINYTFLLRDGQTVGKKIFGIQIVTTHNKIPPLWKSFIIREFFPDLLYYISRVITIAYFIREGLLGLYLFDTLFIFRPDQRCIHDFLAGTKVIDKVQFLAGARFRAREEEITRQALEKQSSASDFQTTSLEKEIPHSTLLRYKMATRMDRFLGYLIDKFAIFIGFALIHYALNQLGLELLFQRVSDVGSSFLLCFEFILVFILLNAYCLIQNQQTLGKVCVGMKIVGMDQTKVSFFKILFFREIFFWGPCLFLLHLPAVIYLLFFLSLVANALFIYREDRRCLHDWACQTRVVYVP